MKYFFLLLFSSSFLMGADTTTDTTRKFSPIGSVKSSQWDRKQVWVKGTIIEKRTDDDFLLQDASDEITLFLTTDALMDMHLQEGMEVEVFGTIDYSTVSRSRTELDADQVIIKSRPKASQTTPTPPLSK